jgi:hypothetical protein
MVQRCWGYSYEQGGLRVRVGEERGGKEMDGCPLTVCFIGVWHSLSMVEAVGSYGKKLAIKSIGIIIPTTLLVEYSSYIEKFLTNACE